MFQNHTLLNKWYLSYKSRQLESLYIEEKKEIQKWLFLIISICGSILQIFFSVFNYYELQSVVHMSIGVVYVIFWIAILSIGVLYPFTVKYALLLLCITITLYVSHSYLNAIDEYILQQDMSQTVIVLFIYGLVYTTYIIFITIPINSFSIRFFSVNFSCLYFCCTIIIKSNSTPNILWIGACICLICLNIIGYFEERFSKIQFVEKYNRKKQLEGWKTLLNESFPVGVVIAKKTMKEQRLKVIFSNQTCRDIFNNEDNAYIESQLQNIQMDYQKQKKSGGTDHRMENHVFIGDCAKQCLSDEIIQYFNLNRQERKMSIVQQGKPYCSFGYYLNEKQEKSHFNIIANNIVWEDDSCFLIILKDVSQKMMYDRLQEIDQYKDQLLASVTHELKTPLNGILAIVQAAEHEEDIFEIKKQLQCIKESGCMLEIILNDILDYSRLQKQKLRLNINKFDMVNTIDDVINIVQIQFSKPDIKIIKEIQMENTIIQSDSNRLKQIIFNLMTNAIKFTERGEIKIIVKKSSSNCMSITVQDTGVGIPENLQKKLFKLYGTFDHSNGSNRHGVGLGLVITKNLVALLGPSNYINLESTVGKGSSFTFEIYNKLKQEEDSLADLVEEDEGTEDDLAESKNIIQCFDPSSNNANVNNNNNNNIINSNIQENNHNIEQGYESSPPTNTTSVSKSIQPFISRYETEGNNFTQTEGSPIKTDQGLKNLDQEKVQLNSYFPQGIISKNIFSQQNIQADKRKHVYRKSSAQIYHTTQNTINKTLAQQPPQLNCDVKKRHRNSFYIPQHKYKNNENDNNSVSDQYIIFNTPQFKKNSQNTESTQIFTSLTPSNTDEKFENNQNQINSKEQFSSPYQSPSPQRIYTHSVINKKFKVSKSFQEVSPTPSVTLYRNKLSQKCSFDIDSITIPSKSHSEVNVFDIIFKKRTKILIVDDTYLNITALKLILGKCQNLVIDEAFHGQQAIEKIEESQKQNDPFQLVFMDMNMPIMDGVQAIIIIRQKIKEGLLSDLKIAVCSAFGDLQSKMKCIKAGADLHIEKPINKYEMEQQLLQIYNIQLESHS
ncbi:hypothetical protein ABPG74_021566 [Tetrahymena malaccensis]